MRCPLSVHTLPAAASCFVTKHGSMGRGEGLECAPIAAPIAFHKSRGISYINIGRVAHNMTIHHLSLSPRRSCGSLSVSQHSDFPPRPQPFCLCVTLNLRFHQVHAVYKFARQPSQPRLFLVRLYEKLKFVLMTTE